jgi:aconitate hydratase
MPADGPAPRGRLTVVARSDAEALNAATERRFEVIARLDGQIELDYYRQGGILPAVLRRIARETN